MLVAAGVLGFGGVGLMLLGLILMMVVAWRTDPYVPQDGARPMLYSLAVYVTGFGLTFLGLALFLYHLLTTTLADLATT